MLYVWLGMKPVADIAVEAPHQHIRQIVDRSDGLSSLDANDPAIAPSCHRLPPRRTTRSSRAANRLSCWWGAPKNHNTVRKDGSGKSEKVVPPSGHPGKIARPNPQ